jgi:hypothetical protein
MNFAKPINIPLAFHCKLSSLSPDSKEEKDYMSRVQCIRKVDVCKGNVQIFHMELVLSMDPWQNQVKSMEMGASIFEKHEYHLQWL